MSITLDLATKLAGWKVKCPASKTEHPTTDIEMLYYGASNGCMLGCPGGCGGTGEVYLFDNSVRVPCLGEDYGDLIKPCVRGKIEAFPWVPKGRRNPVIQHTSCEGRGWTASTDFAVWMQAIDSTGIGFQINSVHVETLAWTKSNPKLVSVAGFSLSSLLDAVQQLLKETKG